jgi:Protein of unknown function (DUF3618)/DUF883 C-terminal glycine zipper region
MPDTSADVRRDIALTRERMSMTLSQLERRMNVVQMVREHPWPAIGLAVGTGLLLGRSRARATGGRALAVAGAGAGQVGAVLDNVVARLLEGMGDVVQSQVDRLVHDVKDALNEEISD